MTQEKNLRAKWRPRHFAISTGCRGHPCPRRCGTHGGLRIQLSDLPFPSYNLSHMRWTTAKIRQSFLDFFAARGHTIVPSASLIPKGDPTLLFVNAGMVQFKDYFLVVRTPPHVRVVDVQKCLRISGKHNDLAAVGRDAYDQAVLDLLGM